MCLAVRVRVLEGSAFAPINSVVQGLLFEWSIVIHLINKFPVEMEPRLCAPKPAFSPYPEPFEMCSNLHYVLLCY